MASLEELTNKKFKRIGLEFQAISDRIKVAEQSLANQIRRVDIQTKNTNLNLEEVMKEMKQYTPLSDFRSF